MPLSGLGDDSLEGLRTAFRGLSVRGPEGKQKEKEKQAVDMGGKEVYPGDGYEPPNEVPFEDTPQKLLVISLKKFRLNWSP